MHRTALLFGAICFILVGTGCYFVGMRAVDVLENFTQKYTTETLRAAGQDWADVRTDGMLVHLSGLAPDEASRFKALETLGTAVQMSRVRDDVVIAKNNAIEPPRFTLEMLRNEDRISLIGLIPQSTGRERILDFATQLADSSEVADMLEIADHPVGAAWERSLAYGLEILKKLPRSKISISPDRVTVTAVTESVTEKQNTEQFLTSSKPSNVELTMNISSPRPVIAPFTFRLTIDGDVADLTACSADTQSTRSKILRSVSDVNLRGKPSCNIGLGVPTTDWARAISLAVDALQNLGGGTLSFTDSDVSLVASEETSQETFDSVVGQLDNSLPELFSLHAVLPPKLLDTNTNAGIEIPEFTATKSPEGVVQLRGRVPTDDTKLAIDTFAQSLFGGEQVFLQTRVDENLEPGWPVRILGGLEALSKLHHGSLIVRADTVEVKGVGATPSVPSEVSRALSVRIGGKGNYKIDVNFDETLFVVDKEPTPEECEQGITALLAREQINFAPSSARIDAQSLQVVGEIADILRKCPDAKFEIEGHTDSQGSEELNLSISQQRAESVLSALLEQRILTSGLTAKGYGPEKPVADNGTEEGRAANRRIAFRLIESEGSE
ncbi:membrane protein [Amylibacter ulvae]|uniref:Membrane protein n=1 Tax=Paramylibacter ulvae TaxID=1651968 RepID=A0ABQ3D499_9RHOB|nr:OmpA family protein [Amylibacter ulvae]GHA58038.1 membrane protein [Amylibacter ulvae]